MVVILKTKRFVIPESPRWLLCKGRVSEVKAIIKAAAEFNGRDIPPNMDKLLKPPAEEEGDEGCVKLFGTKYLRLITICFLCIWFTMNMVYYGMILNMNSFGGNVYRNTVSIACVFFYFKNIVCDSYYEPNIFNKFFFCNL